MTLTLEEYYNIPEQCRIYFFRMLDDIAKVIAESILSNALKPRAQSECELRARALRKKANRRRNKLAKIARRKAR